MPEGSLLFCLSCSASPVLPLLFCLSCPVLFKKSLLHSLPTLWNQLDATKFQQNITSFRILIEKNFQQNFQMKQCPTTISLTTNIYLLSSTCYYLSFIPILFWSSDTIGISELLSEVPTSAYWVLKNQEFYADFKYSNMP